MWAASAAASVATGNALEWIRAAESARVRGDLNQAIQCLYWASVAQLEQAGVVRTTAGVTPRELLRAVPVLAFSPALQHLTAALEQFWYARIPAAPEDFARCLQDVEAVGCKLA